MDYLSTDPNTGVRGEEFPLIENDQLEKVLEQASIAFSSWRGSDLEQRRTLLKSVGSTLRSEAGRLASIIVAEMGKRIQEAFFEVQLCAQICDYYADNL